MYAWNSFNLLDSNVGSKCVLPMLFFNKRTSKKTEAPLRTSIYSNSESALLLWLTMAKRREVDASPVKAVIILLMGALTAGLVSLAYTISDDKTKNTVSLESVILSIHPNFWAAAGVASAVGFSCTGAAFGIWTISSSISGHGVKTPHVKTKNLVSIVFCEASAIYGLITAILLNSNFNNFKTDQDGYFHGYIIFGAGLTEGIVNLVSGIAIGTIGSACVLAHGPRPKMFVKLIIVAIFASAIGLFGLIVGVFMSSR